MDYTKEHGISLVLVTFWELVDWTNIQVLYPTWRIIPVSKWLGSPPFTSNVGLSEGEEPYLGDLLTMVINHSHTGMILQVIMVPQKIGHQEAGWSLRSFSSAETELLGKQKSNRKTHQMIIHTSVIAQGIRIIYHYIP